MEQPTIPDPGPDEVRIKVLAAGTGFTDIFIRRGRYPDYKGPLPFTPGYDIVGIVDKVGPRVAGLHQGQMVADLCVVGGYTQYAIRPARFLVPVPDGVDPAEAVCIPLAYLTAFQMLTRYPSSLMLLSEILKVTVPPSPPLSVRAMVNRSVCSLSRTPASLHTFSTVSSMAGGPHAHVERSFQSGTRPSSAAKSTLPMSAVSCRCSR
jgi:Alcohol dehydrogenase GroES-like domain